MKFSVWKTYLESITHDDADWVLDGLQVGFPLGINPGETRSAKRNCRSAYDQPQIIDNYLAEELKAGSMVGPFPVSPIENIHVNRFGVIPKSTPGKFRLIHNLLSTIEVATIVINRNESKIRNFGNFD